MNDNLTTNQQDTATQTPKEDIFGALLREIQEVVSLPEDAIRTSFAVALSTKLGQFPPLWFMLVGAPSSAKTDLFSLLKKLDFVYFLDTMTLNPFSSGFKGNKGEKTYDLLPELNNRCFVMKDYTPLFSMAEETTKKLLGEMVAIFDGEFSKFSSTRGRISYVSSFSHLGAITPAALNTHSRYLSVVGARFMFYRIPDLTDDQRKRGFEIAWNKTNRKELLSSLSEKVIAFFNTLLGTNPVPFEITDQTIRYNLEKLASLLAKSRGIIILQSNSFKNDQGDTIHFYDIVDKQVEAPWRAFQQLRGLAIALAILDGRAEVNDSDLRALRGIVMSSMPPDRAEALGFFLEHNTLDTKILSDCTGKSSRTCQRLVKELEGLGIIKHDPAWVGIGKIYILEEDFKILQGDKTIKITTPSDSLSQQLPNKPIANYSDEEILGLPVFIKDYLEENNSEGDDEQRQKYLAMADEMMMEGKKRGLGVSDLPVSDQLEIDKTMDSIGN